MLLNTDEYIKIVNEIKSQIRDAQYRAVLGANSEMVKLYWNIGNTINLKTIWGNKFVENLSRDIKHDFPNSTGYSARNLKYIVKFAKTYPNKKQIVQRSVAQLPWRHNIVLMEKIKNDEQREWYAAKTIENGWTRDVLVHQIELKLYSRQEKTKKITNFEKVLSKPIGVSEYKISGKLPRKYKDTLPSIDDIKNRILEKTEIKKSDVK